MTGADLLIEDLDAERSAGRLTGRAAALLADLERRRAERDALIAEASGARLVVLWQPVFDGTLGAVIHRNTHPNALPWRTTWLDRRGEPSGHAEAPTFAKAMEDALGEGYRLAEVRW